MNDDELLEISGSGHGDTELAQAFYEWKALQPKQAIGIPQPAEPIPEDELPEPEWNRRDGELGEFMEYMGGHPLSAAINFHLPFAFKPKSVVTAPVAGAMLGTQLMADPLGALEESLLPSFEPDSWDKTIWKQMIDDANKPASKKDKRYWQEHADELRKTFEPERP